MMTPRTRARLHNPYSVQNVLNDARQLNTNDQPRPPSSGGGGGVGGVGGGGSGGGSRPSLANPSRPMTPGSSGQRGLLSGTEYTNRPSTAFNGFGWDDSSRPMTADLNNSSIMNTSGVMNSSTIMNNSRSGREVVPRHSSGAARRPNEYDDYADDNNDQWDAGMEDDALASYLEGKSSVPTHSRTAAKQTPSFDRPDSPPKPVFRQKSNPAIADNTASTAPRQSKSMTAATASVGAPPPAYSRPQSQTQQQQQQQTPQQPQSQSQSQSQKQSQPQPQSQHHASANNNSSKQQQQQLGGRESPEAVLEGLQSLEEQQFRSAWSTIVRDHLPRLESSNTSLAGLVETCENVWKMVSAVNFGDHKAERNKLLRVLFRLVDTHQDNILFMKICKISMRLASPGGQTLLNTCKLLFKLSKSEGNDASFYREGLMDPILALIENQENQQFEMLLYAVGTLKNISGQESNQKYLSQQGGIPILSHVLSWDGDSPSTEKKAQLLVQATATLRNMAAVNTNRKQFLEFGIIPQLLSIVKAYPTYGELQLNVVRILSKLSLFEDCRKLISADPVHTGALFNLLTLHGRSAPLVIRVCFILGNITSKSDSLRRAIVNDFDGVNTLLGLLFDYSLVDEEIQNEAPGPDGEVSTHSRTYRIKETEDALTKLVRLIAHIAISEDLGPVIARDDGIVPLINLLERKSIDKSEELVLNLVSAVTNLSFYNTEENQLLHVQKKISKILIPLLLHPNEEAVIEAARSFGNFSRSTDVRALMASKRVNEMMVILLDHSNREVVFSVAGVLMNLAGDNRHKATLLDSQIVDKIIEVFKLYGAEDPELSLLCMKVLYNLCLGTERCIFSKQQISALTSLINGLRQQAQEEVQKQKKAARRAGEELTEPLVFHDVEDVAKTVLAALDSIKDLPIADALKNPPGFPGSPGGAAAAATGKQVLQTNNHNNNNSSINNSYLNDSQAYGDGDDDDDDDDNYNRNNSRY